MQKKQTPIDNKLTLVSITRHGRTHSFFIKLPIYKKEKATIEKWNGDVPEYMMGTATPFISLTPGR